jgi:hypothetical protein
MDNRVYRYPNHHLWRLRGNNVKDYAKAQLEKASRTSVEEAREYMSRNNYETDPLYMELDDLIHYLAREWEIYVSIPEDRTVIILDDTDAKLVGKYVDPLSFLRGFYLSRELERERARWDYDTREWDL